MRPISGILSLLAVVIATSSCTNQKEAALRDNLTGTWKKYMIAWDDNNNERADKNEKHAVPEYLAESITFSGEGSGTIIRNTPRSTISSSFTWLVTDKNHLKMTVATNGSSSETEYEVARLKGNELTLKSSMPSLKGDIAWEYYSRQ